ncbi:hypothetical protein [Pseudolysinimonas sp.]|uniref:hypothetical protein n=1 Tax=Pseudolysinimonas sp. TaxID=2680009 RepID=UPI003F7FCE43
MVEENDAHAAELHEEIVPFLGERVVTMFAFAVADGFPAPAVAEPYRREIEESGDDPLDPQVTEAERLLLDWGRLRGAGRAGEQPELSERIAETFQPKLRELLESYASAVVDRCRREIVR